MRTKPLMVVCAGLLGVAGVVIAFSPAHRATPVGPPTYPVGGTVNTVGASPPDLTKDVVTPNPADIPPTLPPGMVVKNGDTVVFPGPGQSFKPYIVPASAP